MHPETKLNSGSGTFLVWRSGANASTQEGGQVLEKEEAIQQRHVSRGVDWTAILTFTCTGECLSRVGCTEEAPALSPTTQAQEESLLRGALFHPHFCGTEQNTPPAHQAPWTAHMLFGSSTKPSLASFQK